MKAIWNDQVVAESDETKIVEGNHYFPWSSIREAYFKLSDTRTHCHWKGEASYLTLEVDGEENEDAAWYYPEPFDAASHIQDYVAFWKGVEVND